MSSVINEAKWLMSGWRLTRGAICKLASRPVILEPGCAVAWPCFRILSRALPAFARPLIIVFIRQPAHFVRQSKFTVAGGRAGINAAAVLLFEPKHAGRSAPSVARAREIPTLGSVSPSRSILFF